MTDDDEPAARGPRRRRSSPRRGVRGPFAARARAPKRPRAVAESAGADATKTNPRSSFARP